MNPAPALVLPESAYRDIDTLVLNESESAILSGRSSTGKEDPHDLARQFLQKGVKDAVIITLGGEGVVYAAASGASGHVAAKRVQVVDTTAAGDTFMGGYAVERAKGTSDSSFDHERALEFATLAASKTVERRGAMAAIPYLREL